MIRSINWRLGLYIATMSLPDIHYGQISGHASPDARPEWYNANIGPEYQDSALLTINFASNARRRSPLPPLTHVGLKILLRATKACKKPLFCGWVSNGTTSTLEKGQQSS